MHALPDFTIERPDDWASAAAALAAQPQARPLAGGTDGGNAEVLLHNAKVIARAELGRPVVLAGNAAGNVELSTDDVCGIKQRDVVSALGGGCRAGHAGRSGTNDSHV